MYRKKRKFATQILPMLAYYLVQLERFLTTPTCTKKLMRDLVKSFEATKALKEQVINNFCSALSYVKPTFTVDDQK